LFPTGASTVYVQTVNPATQFDVVTPTVQVFDTTGTSVTVETNTDPALKAIVSDVGTGSVGLLVEGS
jgi:hypothetical protein